MVTGNVYRIVYNTSIFMPVCDFKINCHGSSYRNIFQ